MKIYKLPDPKDFFLLGDLTVIPFKVTINQEISSIATVSECKIFVGLTDGSIFSLSIIPPNSEEKVILEMMTDNSTIIEELNSEQSLIREPDGTGIIQIGVDFVQEKIYAVRNQSGLIRCSFKDCSNATVLKTNSINYIERIAVDSWNGFLYYSTKDGDVFVATLFPSEAFSSYSFTIQRRVAQIPQIFTMEIDYRTLSLISTLKNGSLISMDLVDNSIKNLRENLAESEKYNFVQKSVFFKGNFFWTSSDCSDEHEWKTCLYGEEQDPESGIVHLNRYLFPGKVVDLGILDSSPRPSYLMPPEEVGLVVSGKESRATWEPPLSLPFQAPGTSWRDLKYIYKLIEDSSGTVLETSETRDLGVFLRPSLGPSANYSLLVQACIDQEDEDIHTCSRPSKTFLTTPENSPTSILIYTDPPEGEHLSTFDILGKQVFDEVYFPKLSINPPEVVGFDNSTKSIYTATRNDISIFRVYPTRVKYRFLDFLTVTHLTILPTKALVVFSSAYQIVQYRLTATFDRIVKSGKVSCAVAATNEKNLIGKYSDLVTVDSSDVRPLVRLFAIDSISNLIPISNWSTIWDGVRIRRESTIALEGRERGLNLSIVQNNIELQPNMSSENQETDSNSSIFSNDVRVRTRRQSTTSPKYQGMAFVDNKLYAIRKEDSVQPFAVMLDVNNANTVLHKVQLNLEFHEVDAVTSDWVANRLLFVAGHDIFQLVLDTFESLTVATPQKLFGLSSGAQDAKQLIFDPFANVAYLLTKNGSLFKIDIVHGTEENLGISLDCLKSQTVISLVADFKWNRASSPTIYALTWNGLISFKPTSEECSEVDIKWDKFGEKGIKSVLSIALADEIFVFGTASDLIIYDKNTASPISIPIQNSPMKQILALSQSSQPYPERSCFQLPNPETIQFNVTNEGRSGALVTVVTPVPPTACQNVSFPPTQYEVYFKRKKTDKVKHFRSISNQIHIENGILDKETDYDVYLSWLNRYYTYKDLLSEVKSFRTGYGFPTAPKDSSAFSLTPDTVLLYWKLPSSLNAPKEEIKYRISQQSSSLAAPVSIGAKQFENGTFSNIFSDIVSCVLDPCQAQIANLRPASDYKFWVTAVHIKSLIPTFGEDLEAVSPEAPTRTIDIPGILRLENETSDSLILRWNFLDPVTVPQIINIQYRLSGGETAWTSSNTTFDPRGIPVVNVTISPLRSSTAYDFRFVATYSGKYTYDGVEKNFIEQFYQPIQQARTKPGTPSAPTNVEITKEKAFWILKWSNPENDGGAPIISFAVEYRPNKTSEWEIAERGIPSEKLWWKLDKPSAYTPESQFRVRAANSEGFGPYGFTQEIEVKEETGNKLYYYALWIGMIFIFAFLAFCSAVIFFVHKNNKKEKMRKFKVNKSIKLDELNLQSAEIPKPFQNDLKNLPHVSRDCVKVSEKIGRGSFGEVYRGDAWNLPLIGTKRVPVAIKTLKEGYSNEDKIKFIKEAILMNNFDHPNIVKLLGVCFEAEPHLIILELMEGGDLQNFLRSCRPHDSAPSQLSLNELFSIIIDVGRGCAYLEMHKHVHRDLAARNCLITSKSSSNRVTKIADFGLARQMYLNEYYRVRGEDFLPLRWLAVESSLDGVFTTKTDVWAYGVLCWEAFTLGEQPYRELMNSMILPFLRSGNRLEKPNECPDEVFEIISSCWDSNPDKRPSFSELVRQLEALHNRPDMRSNSPFPLHQNGYINSGFDASQDSSIGQLDHHHRRQQSAETHRFDKTESSKKNSGLPGHLRQRVGNSFSGERPESSFSGQTEITICDDLGDDYEVPRGHPPNSSLSSSSGFQSGQRSVSPSDSKRKAKVSRV
ncbi:hypothetical protein FO519_008530 [Halicephalobus sp. NKZ332]|nr:hypothetical protein FO519_008530 [Halicephalobus sp. NKZ332]